MSTNSSVKIEPVFVPVEVYVALAVLWESYSSTGARLLLLLYRQVCFGWMLTIVSYSITTLLQVQQYHTSVTCDCCHVMSSFWSLLVSYHTRISTRFVGTAVSVQ